jgi:tRNA threonylcarbamoyladenosine biosynthesis protein TsaB
MKILAVEFSSSQRSVALLEGPQPTHAPPAIASDALIGGHAPAAAAAVLLARAAEVGGRRAIGLIEQALEHAHCEREQIDVVAIGLGPGSYTGIRGAIALAQGWQIGRGIKLLGVSSVECLAAQARAANMRGLVNIIIDAQRNEFYLACYEIDADAARQIEPLHLAEFSQIETLARQRQQLIGPDIVPWFASATNVFPDAAMLGRIALSRRDFVLGEQLEPIYLRETAFKKAPGSLRKI